MPAASLLIDLDAAETGKQIGVLLMDDFDAIELGANLHVDRNF